jgi:hypothetical protein
LLGGPEGAFHVIPLSVGNTPAREEYGTLLVGDITGDGKADVVFVPGVGATDIEIAGDGTRIVVPQIGSTEVLGNTCL